MTVTFCSEPGSAAFCFDREFWFPCRRPYHFLLCHGPGGERHGHQMDAHRPRLARCLSYTEWQARLEHRGYALRWFGKVIPMPLVFLLGRGDAWERAIDESSFSMAMAIWHRAFGKVYGYRGTFHIGETLLGV